MNARTVTNRRNRWSRVVGVAGGLAMLVGAIDPMEGSLAILVGSGLVALGACLGHGDRRLVAFSLWVFILITIGVGALWSLSAVGGIGGGSGRSYGWGLLILPYLIGWSMGTWGPASPRWMVWSGLGVGLWYMVLMATISNHSGGLHDGLSALPAIVLGVLGMVTIGGCINRLRDHSKPL